MTIPRTWVLGAEHDVYYLHQRRSRRGKHEDEGHLHGLCPTPIPTTRPAGAENLSRSRAMYVKMTMHVESYKNAARHASRWIRDSPFFQRKPRKTSHLYHLARPRSPIPESSGCLASKPTIGRIKTADHVLGMTLKHKSKKAFMELRT
jgi:hypothetical protein